MSPLTRCVGGILLAACVLSAWARAPLAAELAKFPARADGKTQFVFMAINCDIVLGEWVYSDEEIASVLCELGFALVEGNQHLSYLPLPPRYGLKIISTPFNPRPSGAYKYRSDLLKETDTKYWTSDFNFGGEAFVGNEIAIRPIRLTQESFGLLVTRMDVYFERGGPRVGGQHTLYGIRNGKVAQLWDSGRNFKALEIDTIVDNSVVEPYLLKPDSAVQGFYHTTLERSSRDEETFDDLEAEWFIDAYYWNPSQQRIEKSNHVPSLYAVIFGSFKTLKEAQTGAQAKNVFCDRGNFSLFNSSQFERLTKGLIIYASIQPNEETARKLLSICEKKNPQLKGYVKRAR